MSAQFAPTHVVPATGMATWAAPDPSQPTARLDPQLPVQVVERRGEWARILCSNGWEAWVDARRLVSNDPIQAEVDVLSAKMTSALTDYKAAADDAAAGRLTPDEFRRRAFTIGHIVHGDVAWLLDISNRRWVRYDGIGIKPLEIPDA